MDMLIDECAEKYIFAFDTVFWENRLSILRNEISWSLSLHSYIQPKCPIGLQGLCKKDNVSSKQAVDLVVLFSS